MKKLFENWRHYINEAAVPFPEDDPGGYTYPPGSIMDPAVGEYEDEEGEIRAGGGTLTLRGGSGGHSIDEIGSLDIKIDGRPIKNVTQFLHKIFTDLHNDKSSEYHGWKENVEEDGWNHFIKTFFRDALEEWATSNNLQFDDPDHY